MKIKFLSNGFSICKLPDLSRVNLSAGLFFVARTPEEFSLVCYNEDVPDNAVRIDPGWKAFHIEGQLDFALVGILSRIAQVLAARGVSIFAVSTYDTDYVLVKEDKAAEARAALLEADYEIV